MYEVKMWKWWFLSLAEIQVKLQWANVKIIQNCFESECSKLQLHMYSMQEISHQVGNYKTDWCNTSVAKLKMGVQKYFRNLALNIRERRSYDSSWYSPCRRWDDPCYFKQPNIFCYILKLRNESIILGRKESLNHCNWKKI